MLNARQRKHGSARHETVHASASMMASPVTQAFGLRADDRGDAAATGDEGDFARAKRGLICRCLRCARGIQQGAREAILRSA